ncbi:AAA family ATPase, partial [uncultured Duncaniella sp.]|uniref:AAA family ATPase n=1 Tax=uncultured Duncaniella sp. TaxID=2768039 RepID=UPI00349F1A55
VANMLNDGKGNPIELDAASNSGVDNARELVKQMRSYPVGCNYKVFILDEVHAFSSNAWQALLKPIEEQPAKTVIILCTTNPEKIPATILSRVQTFQLSKISLDGIVSRLKFIIESENKEGKNITYTDDAVSYIAKLANGGMRDSITLLEKSLSFSTDITIENLTKSLDLPNYDDYFILLNGIAKKDNQVIVKLINDVYNSGVNFVKWFEGFHSFISNIIKYIFIQDINSTMIPSYYQDKISKYGTAHAALCLKLANKLVKLNQELKSTQYLQELAITYLCQIPQTK